MPVDVAAPPEHRHHARDVAVADVVLLPRRPVQDAVGAVLVAGGREHQVGVVDVGAVLALGQPERHHLAGVEVVGGLEFGVLVLALPDRPETEDGDLLGVPVGEPVEAEDLGERGVARGVPALVRIAVGELRRREERREQLLPLDEIDEVGGPLRREVVVEDALLALALEPVDGRAQQPAGLGVELLRVVGVRIEEQAVRLRHAASLGLAVPVGGCGRNPRQTRDRRVRRRRAPAAAAWCVGAGGRAAAPRSAAVAAAPRWSVVAAAAPRSSVAAAAPRRRRWWRGPRHGLRGGGACVSGGGAAAAARRRRTAAAGGAVSSYRCGGRRRCRGRRRRASRTGTRPPERCQQRDHGGHQRPAPDADTTARRLPPPRLSRLTRTGSAGGHRQSRAASTGG